MRLIDADYVQRRAANTFNVNRATLGEESMLWRFQQIVDEAPTVQGESMEHGRWIPHPTEREWDVCTACGIGCKRREYEDNAVSEYNLFILPQLRGENGRRGRR